MHKKYLVLFFSAILALLWYGSAFSQDPGVSDTARVDCVDKVRPNSQVVLNVYAYNDENLGAFTIGIVFPDTVSNMDISLDSVSFVGTRVVPGTLTNTRSDPASWKVDSTNVVNKNRLMIWAVYLTGQLGPGSGLIAKVYFRTGPAWDSTQYVPVDSSFIPPTNEFGFAPVVGFGFTPAFVKGCLGNPVTPSISVNSPNGGENWRVGSTNDITWTSQNFSNNVKIEYSTNAGSTWNTIVPSTPDDGVHPWTIPNTPTTQARVKISDTATGIPSDMSDANFTISTAPAITVPGIQQVFCDTLCDTLRFKVFATDGDVLDILTISKIGVGDFYTVPHPSPDTGFFTWVPVPADTQNSPYTDTFIVNDGTGLADTDMVQIKVMPRPVIPPPGKEGDVNGDGKINTNDVIFLINFLFKNGPEPVPPPAGDINADCVTTVSDIVYLVNYLFKNGSAPKIRCNPGDINYDGYVNVPDVIYFINYLFKSGPAPRSMKSSDVNADCSVDIVDLIYLINFLFRGGPIPQPGCVEPWYKAVPSALAEVELYESREISGVIEIPISSNFDLPVAGVQILVEFDPSQFEPLDPALTERSQKLSLFSSYKDNHQIIGLLDLQGQNYIQPGTGSIATLRFRPRVANYDLSSLRISEAILVDGEANTLQTTIKQNKLTTPNQR
jgi:hypothetical protein